MSAKDRAIMLAIREALIMLLRAIEDKLDMPHSVPSRRAVVIPSTLKKTG